jgi:hypothetical protein
MSRTDAVLLILTLNLVLIGGTSKAAVPPSFFSSPTGQDIQRGSVAAGKCSRQILKSPGAYESCVTAAQDTNRAKGGDPRSFEAGLFFSAWQQMDMNVRPDFPPSSEEDRRYLATLKPLAVKYLQLYREAQKKAGVTDEQVIVGTGLNLETFQTKLAAAAHGY